MLSEVLSSRPYAVAITSHSKEHRSALLAPVWGSAALAMDPTLALSSHVPFDLLRLKLRASAHGAVGLGKKAARARRIAAARFGASSSCQWRSATSKSLHGRWNMRRPSPQRKDPDHRQMHHDLPEMAGQRRVLRGRSVQWHCRSLSKSSHIRKTRCYEKEDRAKQETTI